MTDFKVTDGMSEAAWDSDGTDYVGEYKRIYNAHVAIEAALSHPDFRAQVAEIMRGMVPEKAVSGKWDDNADRAWGYGRNDTIDEVVNRIQQWEKGA